LFRRHDWLICPVWPGRLIPLTGERIVALDCSFTGLFNAAHQFVGKFHQIVI
jgi:hypothetical protein